MPLTIYLADDDDDDRALFKEALQHIPLPARVTNFKNGVALKDALLSGAPKPDAIFLDLNMPLMTGIECLAFIRGEPSFSMISVIIFSTSFNKRQVERVRLLGADRYLQKPPTFNQLKTLLYSCLRSLQNQQGAVKTTASEFVVMV